MSHYRFFQGKITDLQILNEAEAGGGRKDPNFPLPHKASHVRSWRFDLLWTRYKQKRHLHNQIGGINAQNEHTGCQKRKQLSGNKED